MLIRTQTIHPPSVFNPQQEIDRLLSGGGIEQQASEPWGSSFGAPADNFNAFVERSAEDETAFQLASGGASATSTPKLGGAAAQARGGSCDWGRPAAEESPWFAGGGNGLEAQPSIAQQQAAGGEADGAAKAIGTGTVLHTFVGDYNQPEELSVFEGDKVRRKGLGACGEWMATHLSGHCR